MCREMAVFSRAFGFLRRIAGRPRDSPPVQSGDAFFSECPRCGRCTDSTVRECPVDGSPVGRSSTIPLVLDRRYRFERLLGRGGMGSVYSGRDLTLDRPVAIKVIRADLLRDAAAHGRLFREARTLARLHHPSIVEVYDSGTLADRSPYLVMELVKGHDLRQELLSEGHIEPDRASRILSAICDAMATAHGEGVLHCDLKPENVLLPDDGVEAKVLDFGVAQAIGAGTGAPAEAGRGGAPARDTVEEPLIGTPAYMAPEQLRGEPPDARTDVFSLGVIAFEMLVGDLPFGGGSAGEVALAQTRVIPPTRLESLPAPLSRAVRAALALDADRRPPSPQALAYLIGAATGAL
jgi:eukaryotic-like serine/threonine-protein kinase